MNLEQRILKLLPTLAKLMLAKNWKLALAESCSGGKLAATLTALPGSSKWFDFSLVTYSNSAKKKFLRVSTDLLEKEGAVSEACALAMVKGLSPLDDFRLSITGFAGPDGEHVGLVFIAWQAPNEDVRVEAFHFQGTREQIITQVVYQSLRQMVLSSMDPRVLPSKCFFAIKIDQEDIQRQCLQVGLNLGYEINELEPFNNLHLTLVYLGQQSIEELQALTKQVKNTLLNKPFSIHLSRCQFWKKSKALVLVAENDLMPLNHLYCQLGASSYESFRPHVTIAKGIHPLSLVDVSVNISFQVKSFSLMLSYQGVFYTEFARWNLSNQEKEK